MLQVTSAPGKWLTATIPLKPSNESTVHAVEFVMTDGDSHWDKPAEGAQGQRHNTLCKGNAHNMQHVAGAVLNNLNSKCYTHLLPTFLWGLQCFAGMQHVSVDQLA